MEISDTLDVSWKHAGDDQPEFAKPTFVGRNVPRTRVPGFNYHRRSRCFTVGAEIQDDVSSWSQTCEAPNLQDASFVDVCSIVDKGNDSSAPQCSDEKDDVPTHSFEGLCSICGKYGHNNSECKADSSKGVADFPALGVAGKRPLVPWGFKTYPQAAEAQKRAERDRRNKAAEAPKRAERDRRNKAEAQERDAWLRCMTRAGADAAAALAARARKAQMQCQYCQEKGHHIRDCLKKTADVQEAECLEAVRKKAFALMSLPGHMWTHAVCTEAMRQDPDLFDTIPVAAWNEAICLEGIKLGRCGLQRIPMTLKTEDVCLAAVRRKGVALEHVPEAMKSEAMCFEAVVQDANAMTFVPQNMRSYELQVLADGQLITMHVSGPEEDGLYDVTLTGMNGDELASLRLDPETLLSEFLKQVDAELGPGHRKLMLTDGRLLTERDGTRRFRQWLDG